jgi:hypothetical protein
MPIKPETKLFNRVRDNLTNCHISRIENRINQGIPDCLVALYPESVFVTIELKVVSAGKKIRISPHQAAFHAKHADMGCPTFFLVAYTPANTRTGQLLVYRGEQVLEMLERGIDTEPVERWPYAQPMWHRLRHILGGAKC